MNINIFEEEMNIMLEQRVSFSITRAKFTSLNEPNNKMSLRFEPETLSKCWHGIALSALWNISYNILDTSQNEWRNCPSYNLSVMSTGSAERDRKPRTIFSTHITSPLPGIQTDSDRSFSSHSPELPCLHYNFIYWRLKHIHNWT